MKRSKSFGSALAIGMLFSTGVGSLSLVVQHIPGITVTAKAETGTETPEPEKQTGQTVILKSEQITLDEFGRIQSVEWGNQEKKELLAGGILKIPETGSDGTPIMGINNSGVFSTTRLGDYSNDNKGITNVIFEKPENIEYIGKSAFKGNQLTSITLPNVKTIRNSAFKDNQLTSVTLPNVETIEDSAFYGNQLNNVTLPNVKTIGYSAFYGNQLTSITLPNVKRIENYAFKLNKIKTVTVNNGTPYNSNEPEGSLQNPHIGNETFSRQNWKTLILPYRSSITYQQLARELGLAFQVNNRNYLDEAYFKGTAASSVDFDDNISYFNDKEMLTVDSKEGGSTVPSFTLSDKNLKKDSAPLLNGYFSLAVNSEDGSNVIPPVVPPVKPDNGNGNGNGSGNNNNGNSNETKPEPQPTPQPQPQPDKQATYPHSVYAKRSMRLHKNVSLTNPIKSYKKQARAKAASFKIQGVAYDKNGNKRYKVKGGYITANSKYVADSHFRSNKVKRVRVIGNKVNSYKDVNLSSNKKVRSYKKGTKLNVKRIVKQGRMTRFELNNGRYITGNKQLLIMDQK
ncbi:DUF5776 domain-containing protein [Secundilactobacillus silagei]|uniref:DUF5776 domain-containing protein n=1 Tax=Secundilactobacillus silagei JCM 19001 TaxID=1302250 RepID=A0A1Z5IFB4_9LACO|nr:DUF5776 domain-containing protein [Secundilactobacillus silagei]TDG71608.1 hypothetical protein C5L25_002265 [Secundilactobacillus silagei JCM 19001]GAX00403.1 hypothetical protein IWT126_00418 [Secundilactobacillus silagei JCM 19001]